MTATLLLRLHTDQRLGLGHLARGLAIAHAFQSLGGAVLLAVSGDDRARKVGEGVHPLSGAPLPFECVDLGKDAEAPVPDSVKARAQVALLDQWDHTVAMVEGLRPLKVAVYEDDTDAHEVADLLFQPYLEGLSWPETPARSLDGRKVKPCETKRGSCRVLRGAPYVVVSPEVVRSRPKREPLQPLVVHRLLVTFGGADGPGLAERAHGVLAGVLADGAWTGSVTLLAPGGLTVGAVPRLHVQESMPDLSTRLGQFDAIWCAAGVTLAESVCLGIPAAAWGQNNRQLDMIADLAQAGACFSLGLGPEADLRTTREALGRWLGPEGQDSRQEQSRDGMALLDGGGAKRIAQELFQMAGMA